MLSTTPAAMAIASLNSGRNHSFVVVHTVAGDISVLDVLQWPVDYTRLWETLTRYSMST